jgi:AraC family transcriptional regulator
MAPSRFRSEPSARLAAWQASGAGDGPSVPVRVERFPVLRVAFTRHRGGYQGVHETWDRLRAWAAARGLLATSRPPLYGLCPDDPDVTAEEHLRFDACVTVDDAFELDGGGDLVLGVEEIPAGTYAVGLHSGPYHRLSDTYLDVIGRWFPTSGFEPAPDAVVEHYLNDPSNASPADLRTEVRVRIAD